MLFGYLRYYEAQYACYLDIYGIERHNMPVIWMGTVLGGAICAFNLNIYGIGRHNIPVIWIGTVIRGTICLLFGWARYWEAQYACYLDIYGIGRHNMPVI